MPSTRRRRSLIYESVIEHIKNDLLEGKLQPSMRLPTVAELSRRLGVGQAAVREAYRILESIGILEVTQGRGTYVSASVIDDSDVLYHVQLAERLSLSHLLEARKLIEPGLAALAAQRASAIEVNAIFNTAAEMEELYQQGADFIEPDIRFHELIVVAAHNPVMARMMSALNELLLDSRRRTSRIPGASEKAIHFHKLIAMAIRDSAPDTARELMHQHLKDIERDVLRTTGETHSS